MSQPKPTRTWHRGPPPHIGWWQASSGRSTRTWRWWNGTCWSIVAFPEDDLASVAMCAATPTESTNVEWTTYWPDFARVPRTSPLIPPLNLDELWGDAA
ncbi:hypothetical protein [Rhodoferax sp. WC2427]|uniref:hypothetical protein n=1 Tax=Rhodoferax sp. WC2427 TaxID=3234144 RepID=UPI0034679EB5